MQRLRLFNSNANTATIQFACNMHADCAIVIVTNLNNGRITVDTK